MIQTKRQKKTQTKLLCTIIHSHNIKYIKHRICINTASTVKLYSSIQTVNVLSICIFFRSAKTNPWQTIPSLQHFTDCFIWDYTTLFKPTVSPSSKYFKTALSVSDLCVVEVSGPGISQRQTASNACLTTPSVKSLQMGVITERQIHQRVISFPAPLKCSHVPW